MATVAFSYLAQDAPGDPGYTRRIAWSVRSRLALVPLAAALAALLLCAGPALARVSAHTARAELGGARLAHTFHLARGATYVAVHWRGNRHARVELALSRDGRRFGRPLRVGIDEVGAQRHDGQTYGTLTAAHRARAVRVLADRRLRISLLVLRAHARPRAMPLASMATVSQPKVIPRIDWGANESYRYDANGNEVWPPAFYPIQKVIVHHTATANDDPNPVATIQSIYYYHAVTQGWGDIGYNFLIDEQGRIYEGRHTFDYPSGSSPTEQNSSGYGVTAAHAQGYNSGTVGIALLGTLTDRDATPAARSALESLIAWIDDSHGIDPHGAALYTNPVNGTQATFPNIAGHRDVAATECPGSTFYATLPTIRDDVAALIAGGGSPPPPSSPPTVTTGSATSVGRTYATLNGSVNPNGLATTYWFQYGTTTTYGLATASTSLGSGTTAQAVSASVSGLSRATRYHFRVVASNSAGTSYGADATFRTRK